MTSPWSPPKWMKDNRDTRGGFPLLERIWIRLCPIFGKIIFKQWNAEGIKIDALTIQKCNHLSPGNTHRFWMLPEQPGTLYRPTNLGPAFSRSGNQNKNPSSMIIMLIRPRLRRFRFFRIHCESIYRRFGFSISMGSNFDALQKFIRLFPDKHIYFYGTVDRRSWHLAGDLPCIIKNLLSSHSKLGQDVLEWKSHFESTLTPFTDSRWMWSLPRCRDDWWGSVTRNPAY